MKASHVEKSGRRPSIPALPPNRFRSSRTAHFLAIVALAALGLLFSAKDAKAGCVTPGKAAAAPSIPFSSPAAEDAYLQDDNRPNEPVTIVGLWHVVYTATYTTAGPLMVPLVPPAKPFQFVQSYKTWHGDGTEFENAFLPPTGGDVCFGVWKDLGHGTVKLHHIGLMFDPITGNVDNVFTVDEVNTVAPNGKTYKGSFDVKIFDATDVLAAGSVLQELKGTTAGTRITVD